MSLPLLHFEENGRVKYLPFRFAFSNLFRLHARAAASKTNRLPFFFFAAIHQKKLAADPAAQWQWRLNYAKSSAQSAAN
jgi:hypothetical protein